MVFDDCIDRIRPSLGVLSHSVFRQGGTGCNFPKKNRFLSDMLFGIVKQQIIDIDSTKSSQEIIAGLKLPVRPLIILLGDFDSTLKRRILSVLSRVVAPAALNPGALILDDGCSDCAALAGLAAIDQENMPPLLAIASSTATSAIDGNHPLVLRLPAELPDTMKFRFQLADALVKDSDEQKPALIILFGGGDAEKKALIRGARRDWPILVVRGSGGLADLLAEGNTTPPNGATPPLSDDPDLREILETAHIFPAPINDVSELSRIVLGRIETRSESATATLEQAWQRFDNIDAAALAKQARFRRVELSLIVLAVLAALFAILKSVLPADDKLPKAWQSFPEMVHFLVILIPICITIIAAYNSHFRDGNKWILLRGAAEALKREIFAFRARAGIYSDTQIMQGSRESKLAARIRDITSALEQSEVNKTSLAQQPPSNEKRSSFLTADQYVDERLRDQVKYFVNKTRKLSSQLVLMQIFIYVVGGTGTFLAAYHLDPWVALSTAIVTAITTKLQADQVEMSLIQYNQALVNLKNIETWWDALSAWEKSRSNNIDLLVSQTEKTMESETAGWIQQMQTALDKLTEKEPTEKTGAAAA